MTSNNLDRRAYSLSRRKWLHGAGVLVGLPWLESLPVWGMILWQTHLPPSSRSDSESSLWLAVFIPTIGGRKQPTMEWN